MTEEREWGYCPECGATVSVRPGQPTPAHQPQGERGTCPGTGRPAN